MAGLFFLFSRTLGLASRLQTQALIASAFHMPCAVAVFHRAGWTGITPAPVDFRSGGLVQRRLSWRLDQNLQYVNVAVKEYVGILAYWVAGK
jgi:uncharacterized SAM-binding protein YcdF (DUF218 family)